MCMNHMYEEQARFWWEWWIWGKTWRWILTLIDWCKRSQWKLYFSLYVFDATGFIATHVQFLLNTICFDDHNDQNVFFRPYKSEPADLSSPWASKTPSLLTATYCSHPAQENFWLIDVTALFVNLLFRCLAFSAVALRCVSTPVGGIILSQTTALLLFVAGSS